MKKSFGFLTIGLIICLIGLVIYQISIVPRIGFVRSQDLVYQYEGMKQVQGVLEQQKQEFQNNIDTLEFDFQKALNRFEAELPSLSEAEGLQRKQALQSQQENILRYAESVENQVLSEEEQMLEGVLNQVNNLAVEYGNENGYDVIFGTTQSGNILQGRDAYDITDELLEYMNKTYYEGTN